MSGDVQPRKRRDKKKKKDDGEEPPEQIHAKMPKLPSLDINDDVTIHVHKEAHTGGGLCAKFVFFILLSALAVLIGLIITEHRGLTDLDTIDRESKFTQIFEGWVDNSPDDHHDDHHGAIHDDHDDEHDDEHDDDHDDDHDDEHDEEHDEEEEHDEHDDEDDHEEEGHDEEEEEVEESVQVYEQEEEPSVQEDDEDEVDASQKEDEDDDEDEVEENDEDDEDEEEGSEAAKTEEDQEEEEEEADIDGGQDEASEEQTKSEDNEGDQDEQDEEGASEQQVAASEEADDEDEGPNSEEGKAEDAAEGEEDDEDDGNDDEEPQADDEKEEGEGEEGAEGEEQQIGDEGAEGVLSEEKKTDLARRNTIVIPPKVEEVEHSSYDEYSEEEEIEEEEIKLDPIGKKEYQSLRSTYERSLTPDSDRYDDEEPDEEEDEEELEGEEEIELEGEEEEEPVYEDHEGYDYEPEEEEEPLEGEEPEEGEQEPLSEEDDEELMKKLEAKYGKLAGAKDEREVAEEYEEEYSEEEEEEDEDDGFPWPQNTATGGRDIVEEEEQEAWKSAPSYEFENITNEDDFLIFDQLDEAQENININAALALSQFKAILTTRPHSPRAIYGRAAALDALAEARQSNQLLTEAITNYLTLLNLEEVVVPTALFIKAADRCIDRLRFMGQYGRAINVHKKLVDKFPNDIKFRNQLAVTYLTTNRIDEARHLLAETLTRWSADGFALAHYGFILKVHDNQLSESIGYLRRGLATRQEGVIDGRFYFHLGDALMRLGRASEAASLYLEGVANGVFLSQYQRSLYNIKSLTGNPWWKKKNMPLHYQRFYDLLEKNYLQIRKEGVAVMNAKGYFQDEAENLRDKGDWKQFELFARGVKNKGNCMKCPITCKLVETLPDAAGCRRGQVKFSVMHPGTHVWPHCGPTNCRLRVHLGLKVPPKTFIRVANETRSWQEGQVIIFDDSFEHEVWHNGSEFRLVLIVDVWHPELTTAEKRSLAAI